MSEKLETLWTSERVAEYLDLHRQTVNRMAAAGDLPGIKVSRQWRFRPEDMKAYLDSNRAKAE